MTQQIHAAHGYLINQFLSPAATGAPTTTAALVRPAPACSTRSMRQVRGAVGPDYPVFVKPSDHGGFPGGVEPLEAALVAAALDARGIDAIEVSAGTPEGARRGGWDHIMPAPFVEGRFLTTPCRSKPRLLARVICVEGWRDPRAIAQALQSIDAVSLRRPFIREPHLAARWRSGDLAAATCISCNKCLELIVDRRLGLHLSQGVRDTSGR